jgi:N-acetyl-anhydromuramyl-L-alanine amidase AmpD
MRKPLVAVGVVFGVGALLTAAVKAPPAMAGSLSRRNGAPAVPRAWVPPVKSDRWECIVIHHSATDFGGAARFDKGHRAKGWDELGYHFVIGNGSDTRDGQVEVGPRWTEQRHGAHCRSPEDYYNEHGIGICLVGNFDEGPPTPAQQRSLTKLVRYLCRTYGIPASRVYTHGGVTHQTRCPGAHFDLKALRKSIRN